MLLGENWTQHGSLFCEQAKRAREMGHVAFDCLSQSAHSVWFSEFNVNFKCTRSGLESLNGGKLTLISIFYTLLFECVPFNKLHNYLLIFL